MLPERTRDPQRGFPGGNVVGIEGGGRGKDQPAEPAGKRIRQVNVAGSEDEAISYRRWAPEYGL